MRKTTKIWLVTAAVLVVVGCMVLGGVMAVLGWDFVKLSTNKYDTNKHEIEEDFNAISINTDTVDITFLPSEDIKCSVVCYEQKNVTHSVAVKENMLVIETVDSRKWYEHIGINFGTPQITVYLPEKEYTSLSIKESTGDIEITEAFQFEDVAISLSTGNITVSDVLCAGDVNLHVSTGKATLTNVECKNLISSGSTGDIFLNHVIATEKFSIKRSTGDIRFDGSDAAEISVETSTGDITGTLLSEKVFIAQTDTGKIRVPKTVTGGRCELITDTGNIKIKYAGEYL